MTWTVLFHDEFDAEFYGLDIDVRRNLLAAIQSLHVAGPKLGRPHVDTLDGSKHANMKELRFTAHDGHEVWRAAFAFDPHREAVVLVAGEKQGGNQSLFYKRLIKIADGRFDSHLRQVKATDIQKR